MSYISEIFKRANIQDIASFFMYGTECGNLSFKSYEERLNEADENIHKFIVDEPLNMERQDKNNLFDCIMLYVNIKENVYMEIGLQCGFLLASQIFNSNNMDEEYGGDKSNE